MLNTSVIVIGANAGRIREFGAIRMGRSVHGVHFALCEIAHVDVRATGL